ncbi:hypothetical protein RMCBS344292_15003 [Rhizopus microsporus]|nr:hypothetical protein RMCBS344292_15003 [Rhizopus microsporus]
MTNDFENNSNRDTIVSTEFSQYVLMEKLNNLSLSTYDTNQSLRLWLKDFENQAAYVGITNLDVCVSRIGKFLLPIVRNLLQSNYHGLCSPRNFYYILGNWKTKKTGKYST